MEHSEGFKLMDSQPQQFNPQLYPPHPTPSYFPQQSDQLFYSQMPYSQTHIPCPTNIIKRSTPKCTSTVNIPLQNSQTRHPETLKPDTPNPSNLVMSNSQKNPEQLNTQQPDNNISTFLTNFSV